MWPVLGALGSALIGGVTSAFGAKAANDQTAASVDKQIGFQDKQSKTQYQRAMTDMKAAGLNPMLAYQQGGNSASSGASFTAQNVGDAAVRGAEGGSRSFETGVNSAKSSTMMDTQIENMKADTIAKTASGKAAEASALASVANANLANSNSATTNAMRPFQVERAMYDAGIAGANEGNARNTYAIGSQEAKYVNSPLGAMMRQLAFGGRDATAGISSAKSILPKWLR